MHFKVNHAFILYKYISSDSYQLKYNRTSMHEFILSSYFSNKYAVRVKVVGLTTFRSAPGIP